MHHVHAYVYAHEAIHRQMEEAKKLEALGKTTSRVFQFWIHSTTANRASDCISTDGCQFLKWLNHCPNKYMINDEALKGSKVLNQLMVPFRAAHGAPSKDSFDPQPSIPLVPKICRYMCEKRTFSHPHTHTNGACHSETEKDRTVVNPGCWRSLHRSSSHLSCDKHC